MADLITPADAAASKVPPAPNATGLGAPIKDAIGSIAAFTALSYVFGFLCINAYLSSHGVIIFSPVASEYLAAGLCFGFFYVVAGIIVQVTSPQSLPSDIWRAMQHALQEKVQDARKAGKSEAYLRGFEPSFAFFFTATGLLMVLLNQKRDYLLILLIITPVCYFSTHDFWIFWSWNLWAFLILVPLGVGLLIDFGKQTATWKWRLLPFLLVTLLLSAGAYGRGLYPFISSSIGGGTPVRVRLIIDSANQATAEAALDIKVNSGTTPALMLLLETADSLVLMVTPPGRQGHIVQFKKDQVKAVVYGSVK